MSQAWKWFVSSLVLVFTPPVFGQELRSEFFDPTPWDHSLWASTVVGLDDVNGDGVPDLAVGDKWEVLGGGNPGAVRILSGADGSVLSAIGAVAPIAGLGASMAAVGDLDGDGLRDLIVGAPSSVGEPGTRKENVVGAALLLSGADLTVLREFLGTVRDARLGFSVASAGDVDGDGLDEVVVGSPEEDDKSGGVGRARVFSVRSARAMMTLRGSRESRRFGHAVDGGGDLDRDGFADVVVGDPEFSSTRLRQGRVSAFSGVTGSLLFERTGRRKDDELGYAVKNYGDFDLDGHDDILMSAPQQERLQARGLVSLVSGATSLTLATLEGKADSAQLGLSLDVMGDMSGDGVPDIAIRSGGGVKPIRLYSGRDGSLLQWFDTPGRIVPWIDVDGDGVRDFAIRIQSPHSEEAVVQVWTSSEMFLWDERRRRQVGENIRLRVRNGPAGALATVYVRELGKIPFDFVFQTGVLDAFGGWDLSSVKIPPGTEGLQVVFQAFALPAAGPVVDSSPEHFKIKE